jgi:acetyl esterase/lipase
LFFTVRVGAVCLFPFALGACNPLYWVGIQFLYDEVPLPAAQIVRDIPYDPSVPDDAKRQLDLFTPADKDWPIVVFIHGGGWDTGDRRLKIGGADIYGNIGRMLASHGFGAAVISYRLLDSRIDWQMQVRDVARAVGWVQQNATKRGGRAKSVFLMGHSAGAQLAMRLAADPTWLAEAGGDSSELCGVVGVSGAAYDLDDPETLALETEPQYYPRRFARGTGNKTWKRDASPIHWLDSDDPPFLLLYAEGDYKSLIRQSHLADQRLRKLGIGAGLVRVPGTNHNRIVLRLSQPSGLAGESILKFLRNTRCPRSLE